jgi:hypothetical protein
MLMLTVSVENTIKLIEVENGGSYQAIRDGVGGCFDCVHIPSLGVDMWLHDEGKILEMPMNAFGTALWVSQYGMSDFIAGNIVITGGVDKMGETLGLTIEQAMKVIELSQQTINTIVNTEVVKTITPDQEDNLMTESTIETVYQKETN